MAKRKKNPVKPWWRKLYPTAKVKSFKGKMVPVYYVGIHKDGKGLKWKAYGSKINDMSSWVRLERKGHNARMAYDAGGSFRRSIEGRRGKNPPRVKSKSKALGAYHRKAANPPMSFVTMALAGVGAYLLYRKSRGLGDPPEWVAGGQKNLLTRFLEWLTGEDREPQVSRSREPLIYTATLENPTPTPQITDAAKAMAITKAIDEEAGKYTPPIEAQAAATSAPWTLPELLFPRVPRVSPFDLVSGAAPSPQKESFWDVVRDDMGKQKRDAASAVESLAIQRARGMQSSTEAVLAKAMADEPARRARAAESKARADEAADAKRREKYTSSVVTVTRQGGGGSTPPPATPGPIYDTSYDR